MYVSKNASSVRIITCIRSTRVKWVFPISKWFEDLVNLCYWTMSPLSPGGLLYISAFLSRNKKTVRNGKLRRTFVQSIILVFDKNKGVWWYEVPQILSQSKEGSAMHCNVDPFFSLAEWIPFLSDPVHPGIRYPGPIIGSTWWLNWCHLVVKCVTNASAIDSIQRRWPFLLALSGGHICY